MTVRPYVDIFLFESATIPVHSSLSPQAVRQTLAVAIDGFCVNAPLLHFAYAALDRWVARVRALYKGVIYVRTYEYTLIMLQHRVYIFAYIIAAVLWPQQPLFNIAHSGWLVHTNARNQAVGGGNNLHLLTFAEGDGNKVAHRSPSYPSSP